MKTRRPRAVPSLLLVLASLLTACGGGDQPDAADPATSQPPASDGAAPETPLSDGPTTEGGACGLLSTAEVSEAVGAEVSEGVPTGSDVVTGGSQTTCTWTSADNPMATAMLAVYTDASAADSVRTDDSQPLPEVGDRAFVGPFASVWAYAGEGSFTTQWYDVGGTDEENLPSSIALARLVLDRL